ncbi:MAG: aminotransferase class III-fold pyridoxal phosphate-dependent enzyme [Planctomycetes bacterium]|nr:aminotransferase class III-fold pyridoxal phosphate-dependent enzyme [Planctomycetota bacterium]
MKPLAADNFRNDPRLAEARRLLLDTAADHQRQLNRPRPGDPERKVTYEQALADFTKVRGGGLYFPYLGSGFGAGPLVELADGSVKYDMICGIGVHHLGHGHPALVAAAFDAAASDTTMQGNLQQDLGAPRLAFQLVGLARRRGARLSHCFLTSSGAMANENALKLALSNKSPADRVLAFEHCFMGRTLALSQVTDNAKYRVGLPTVLHVDYVPFFDTARPRESTDAALSVLRRHLADHPGRHGVMCMELVQGEGGYNVGDRDFFVALLDVLKEQRVGVLVDEVQTFGRTTEPFVFQHFGLDGYVDLVTVGKMTQACATLFTDEFTPKPGLISQTFTAATSAILTGSVVIEQLEKSNVFGADGRNVRVNRRFTDRLSAIAQRHPGRLSGPFGIGAMIAFTPFDGDAETAKRCAQLLFDEGVIGFVAGSDPTRLRFLPPVPVLTDDQIDSVCDIVDRALARAAAQHGKG